MTRPRPNGTRRRTDRASPSPPRTLGPAASSPEVLAEVRRCPWAGWIARDRAVGRAAFESAARRVRRGLTFGVAARIEDARGRILLVRMTPRRAWTRNWTAPGGGAEPGETPRDAVRREILEETGIAVKDLRLWKVFHETLRSRDGAALRWDFLHYTARWRSGAVRPRRPEEIAEARWFSRLPRATEFREDWRWPPVDRFRRLRRRAPPK